MCLHVSVSQIWPAISTPSFIFAPLSFFFSLSFSILFMLLQPHLGVSCFVFFSFSPRLPFLSPLSPGRRSALPAPVHSLGSTGSETVTQSSLVIGHGHANQTGRNLQLIRILPPAIIVPSRPPLPSSSSFSSSTQPPTPRKLITFGGLLPLLVFLF